VPRDLIARLQSDLARLAEQPRPAGAAVRRVDAPERAPLWSLTLPEGNQLIAATFVADLDGDGRDEILAAQGNSAFCLSPDGKVRWSFETKGLVRALCAGELTGEPPLEVVVGSDDEHFYVLDAAGKQLRKHHLDNVLISGTGHVRQNLVNTLHVADLDGDGAHELIVGTMNCHVAVFGREGRELWRYGRVYHGSTECQTLDLDGDGKLEVLVGNRYGGVHVFDAAGHRRRGVSSEIGDVVFDVADLDGDKVPEIANGSSTGVLHVASVNGVSRWHFDNFGYAVWDLEFAELSGRPGPELLVASDTGYLYLVSAEGATIWQRNLFAGVRSVAIARAAPEGEPVIAAGTDDGHVFLLNAQGEVLQQVSALQGAVRVRATRLAAGAGQQFIASDEAGHLVAFECKSEPRRP